MEFLKNYGEKEAQENRKRPLPREENLPPKKMCLESSMDLKLPSFIFDPEIEEKNKKEAQEKNLGKVRQFEHMKGNFPTFVFIKIPETDNLQQFTRSSICQSLIKELVPIGLQDLHISLSKTFPLRIHQKDMYIDKIKEHLKNFRFKSFDVSLSASNYQYFLNEDFSSLNVVNGKREVIELISIIDSVHKLFEFPLFYTDPKPHSSIAWCINNSSLQSNPCIPDAQSDTNPLESTNGIPSLSKSITMPSSTTTSSTTVSDSKSIMPPYTTTSSTTTSSTTITSDSKSIMPPYTTISFTTLSSTTISDSKLVSSTKSASKSATISDIALEYNAEINNNAFPLLGEPQLEIENFEFEVDQIYCKIGQWTFSFPL